MTIVFQQCWNACGEEVRNLERFHARLHQPCGCRVLRHMRRHIQKISAFGSIVEGSLDILNCFAFPQNDMPDVVTVPLGADEVRTQTRWYGA
jgi:hypothetical protein